MTTFGEHVKTDFALYPAKRAEYIGGRIVVFQVPRNVELPQVRDVCDVPGMGECLVVGTTVSDTIRQAEVLPL